jgi:NADH-quinone oxidoreductase subunit D
MDEAERVAARVSGLLARPDFAARTTGVGVLAPDIISQYGVSGPAARASGVALDLRTDDPYLGYAELAPLLAPAPVRPAGDAWTRFAVMRHDVCTSIALVRAAVDRLETLHGPVSVRLPKIVKLPEGQAYLATEAPLGIAGVHLVSRGDKTPWRLKLRTASFNNVSALESLLVGVAVEHLEVTLASMGYVVGDIDK